MTSLKGSRVSSADGEEVVPVVRTRGWMVVRTGDWEQIRQHVILLSFSAGSLFPAVARLHGSYIFLPLISFCFNSRHECNNRQEP